MPMPTLKPSEPMVRLPDARPIPIFFHTDADGCCSAAIVADWLEMRKVKFKLRPKDAGTVDVVEPGIYLDLAGIPANQVTKDTIVVDHHPGPKLACQYFNPRTRGESLPTSHECFRLFGRKELVWIAAAGCAGDNQPSPDLNKLTQELYGDVDLKKAADLIDAHYSVKGSSAAKDVVELLLKFKESPSGFLRQKSLLQSWSKVEEEIDRVISQKPQKLGKLIIVKFSSDLRIKSQIANKLKEMHPEQVVLVVHECKGEFKISLREMKEIIDFSEALPRITAGLKAQAGGHPVAAGGKVAKSDFDEFIQRLSNEIG